MPVIRASQSCASWQLTVAESSPAQDGIAEVLLLNDSIGIFGQGGRVSTNCKLTSLSPSFVVGVLSEKFLLAVIDPKQDAKAYVYAVDGAGNDTVITQTYTAPRLQLDLTQLSALRGIRVGSDTCITLTLHSDSVDVDVTSVGLSANAQLKLSGITPALPVILHKHDSLTFSMCFVPVDTSLHTDPLIFHLGCFDDSFSIRSSGASAAIEAYDLPLGDALIGDSVCMSMPLANVGSIPLTIFENFTISDSVHFRINDRSQFPATIQPHTSITVRVCYYPTSAAFDSAIIVWPTDLAGAFADKQKDRSVLRGHGVIHLGVAQGKGTGNGWRLNPNPASSGEMSLYPPVEIYGEEVSISLLDILGRERIALPSVRAGYGAIYLSTTSLERGTYYVRLGMRSGVATLKIVR